MSPQHNDAAGTRLQAPGRAGKAPMPNTLKDVARLAGVHVATASRALNPATKRLVSEETRERIEAAARQLGYVGNHLARSLRTNRSGTIAAIVPDIANPLFPPILLGIQRAAEERGYLTFILNNDDPTRSRERVTALRERQIDGVILASASLADPLVATLDEADMPLVLVNRTEHERQLTSVESDDRAGIRMSVDHVVGRGHRRIGYLGGPETVSTGQVRAEAFFAAMRRHGLEGPTVAAAAYGIEPGQAAAAALLDAHPDLTAVVTANDLLSMGLYDALAARGLTCPGDVSVVGFNDVPLVDRVDPPLTTIRLQHRELGIRAAELLFDQIERRSAYPASSPTPATLVLPVELVERASVRDLRAG